MARKPPARTSKKKSPQIADTASVADSVAASAADVRLEQPLQQDVQHDVETFAGNNAPAKEMPPQKASAKGVPKVVQHQKASGKQANAKKVAKQVATQESEPQIAPVASDTAPNPQQAPKQSNTQAPKQHSAPAPKQPSAPAPKQPSNQATAILPLPQFLAQKHGFHNLGQIFHNLSVPELYEHILFLREGVMSADGAVMVETTPNTKLAVRDKFIVEESVNKDNIAWGEANRAIDQAKFNGLRARIGAYLQRRNVYVQDCFVGSDTRLRVPFRIVTEQAWQSLFVRNTFAQALPAELRQFEPRMTIVVVPNFKAIPEIDGTRAETFVLYDFSQRLAIIGGTRHAEEIKKAVFTVMSYAMPLRRVLPMRCAATVGANGDTVLLMGTNGAGKTALSADPARMLVGDDAHGWSDDGIFAFEQGSYAKTLNITAETDASVYAASKRFGTVLENVKFDPATRQPLFADTSITDNARISFVNDAVSHVQPIAPKLRGAHPKTAIILVNDAFGVLPPVARLTHEQAVFFYLSGYAAKNPVGMETREGKNDAKFEPRAVFSAALGETFMVQDPLVYANLFRERLRRNNTRVWLVNTGWQSGTQASGSRIKRDFSRAIISAISSGALDSVQMNTDPIFHINVPASCPNVTAAMLNPRNAWSDKAAYDKTAQKLLSLLTDNFKKYAGRVDKAIQEALNGKNQVAASGKQAPTPQNAAKHAGAKQVTASQTSTSQTTAVAMKAPKQEEIPSEEPNEVPEAASNLASELVAETPAPLETNGKKSKKKAKPQKKGRTKEVLPDEDEAEVGDTGALFDAASAKDSQESRSADEGFSDAREDDIYIPPGLFASEQGEFRPDDDEMPIVSEFNDEDESDEAAEENAENGGDGDDTVQGQSQYRGRRRRGGRGRRRPR
ncbi:MAG: phosphoenolpyruvate carboxykinase (ATP) [Candidatus Kapabacteria bacterium]|jgi:phosphoenolpyruvate carboxykinase (ATP)|nr:phosphoenolpyruvate carboxykinase (ATP) [Candidatus Kapabacteria bacterium]